MTNPLCLCRTMWATAKSFLAVGNTIPISGHDYIEVQPRTRAYVHVLRCRCCGATSIGWEPDASPTQDPIAAAVDAQLTPLADDLTAFGHKLAKEPTK